MPLLEGLDEHEKKCQASRNLCSRRAIMFME